MRLINGDTRSLDHSSCGVYGSGFIIGFWGYPIRAVTFGFGSLLLT